MMPDVEGIEFEIMTVPQVAKYLQISSMKGYMMVRKGMLPYFRMGKSVRIRKVDLKKWIEDNIKNPTE